MRGASVLRCVAATGIVLLVGCQDDYQPREQPVGYYYPAPAPAPMMAPAPMPEPLPVIVQEPPAEPIVRGFYDELSPYGQWVAVGGYGRCWQPAGVGPTWRPYTVGHWVYADCGWTWISEEPWGYSTCHYGRWFSDGRYGWVWVPGSVWAPAWVAWRSGGGYVGWAPLGPSVGVEVNEYYTRSIPASQFCFVREREIVEPHIHRHMVDNRQNVTIINNTTNITRITVVNNTVVNRSLPVEQVERATGRRVERANIRQVASADEARRAGEVAVYRPKALPPTPQLVPVPHRRQEISPIRPAQPQQPQPQPQLQPQPQPQPPVRVRPRHEAVAPAKAAEPTPAETPRSQPGQVRRADRQRPAAPAVAPVPVRNQQKPVPPKPDEAGRKAAQAGAETAQRAKAKQDRRDKGNAADAPGQPEQGGPPDGQGPRGR